MRTPFSRWFFVTALAFTAAAAAVSARPEPQAGGGAPVLIDFRVVAEDGQPVADLKPADVTLRVGGRPRPIKSLDFVRVGGEGAAPAAAAPRLPPPFRTNAEVSTSPGTRREVLIVLDELSISPGKETSIRDSLHKLVSALSPADRVGLLSTRQGGTSHAFTQEHEEIRGALAKLAGYAPAQLSDSDFACNAQLSLATLGAAFREFTPASAPTLVYVSAALAGPASERMANVGKQSELCPLRTTHFEEVGAAAQASHAAIYVVHALDAASASQSPQASQVGIDAVAGATGAETIRLTGSAAESPVTRIARETSAYYLASFDPEPGDRNGNRHRVQLSVARERVRVNARPHIVIARGGAGAAARVTPRDMIRVATVFTDLPLRGTTFSSLGPDGKVRVVALFETLDGSARLNAATVIAYDAQGASKAQWNGEAKDLGGSPIRADLQMPAAGSYRVRIAATDTSGRAGTVDVETHAAMGDAGVLKTSSLVLGVASSGRFSPKLQFDAGDQQAIGYVEIYNVPKGGNVGVTFELADREGGPATATGPAQISGADDKRIAIGGFGIGPMEPGDVEMRAVVTLDGTRVGAVSRTLRKVK